MQWKIASTLMMLYVLYAELHQSMSYIHIVRMKMEKSNISIPNVSLPMSSIINIE